MNRLRRDVDLRILARILLLAPLNSEATPRIPTQPLSGILTRNHPVPRKPLPSSLGTHHTYPKTCTHPTKPSKLTTNPKMKPPDPCKCVDTSPTPSAEFPGPQRLSCSFLKAQDTPRKVKKYVLQLRRTVPRRKV